jgi:pimeloyl-ACP methyl ester carboxylesterase
MPTFTHEGHQLAYTEYGEGPRTVVLVHGLLLAQTMHAPLAEHLAGHGNRVITLDLLGHGKSDRPTEMWDYSMISYGRQILGLLDHLELDQAVLFGTSLGANSSLEVAAVAPERVRGMVIEMPVLDNALLGCAIAFTPALVALTFGAPIMRPLASVARFVQQAPLPLLAQLGLGMVAQDPKPSASVMQGLFFGRVAPPREVRRTLQTPALIIGHRRDPIHPFSDAGMLHDEMPNSALLEANSVLELRSSPERLTAQIDAFVEDCWTPKKAPAARKRKPAAKRVAAG